MDHDEIKALLPLAALDRLEDSERAALDAHLLTRCDECDRELHEYREVAAAIALSLEPAGAPDKIRNRLDARLASESGRPAGGSIDRGTRTASRARAGVWRAATGALAAAAAAIAIYAGILNNRFQRADVERAQLAGMLNSQIGTLRTELESARNETDALSRVLADRVKLEQVLMAPDLQITRLAPLAPAPAGASAIVAVSANNDTAVIQASGLPPTPPDKSYELWWITAEHGPTRAGLFQVESGSVVATTSPPPRGEKVILSAVTLEPAGGVSKPTGAMYLKGAWR